MEIISTLNDVFVRLFRQINSVEEKTLKKDGSCNLTVNDIHVIDAIGVGDVKNMSTVAKILGITTGTLTISVNGLVNKGYVERVRSEEDRRVVLVSLTEKGVEAYDRHQVFHNNLIRGIIGDLNEDEQQVLLRAINNASDFFAKLSEKYD